MAIAKPKLDAIKAYFPGSQLEDAVFTDMIDMAHDLISRELTGVNDTTCGYIVKLVAAHFVHMFEPLAHSVKDGEAQESYEGKPMDGAVGLKSSRFGLRAIEMDPSGRLEQIGKPVAKAYALGGTDIRGNPYHDFFNGW